MQINILSSQKKEKSFLSLIVLDLVLFVSNLVKPRLQPKYEPRLHADFKLLSAYCAVISSFLIIQFR